MDVLYGVRMTGPLALHATGLAGELARLGFTKMSARSQLGLAAHLSRWLAAAGLGTMALTAPVAEEYLAARRAAGYTAYLTPKALAPLLGYLRELGVAPEAEIAAGDARGGLARAVPVLSAGRARPAGEGCPCYVDSVRPFVVSHAAADGTDLRWLTAGDVTAFGLSVRSVSPAATRPGHFALSLRRSVACPRAQGAGPGRADRAVDAGR